MKPPADSPEREETEKSGAEKKQQRIAPLAESQAKVARAHARKQPGAARSRKPGTIAKRIIPIAEADAFTEGLYAKREHVYPREVHGSFATLRVAMVALTLGLGVKYFRRFP